MYARWDNFPAARGHIEIVPRRHICSYFEMTRRENADLYHLAGLMKTQLDTEYGPDAYTLGINDGIAAGQTVAHLHMHLIPRWYGDVPNPEGGIRQIFPGCDPRSWSS